MTQNEIRAAYEEFDKTISSFGKEIQRFSSEMGRRTEEMMGTVRELGGKWKKMGYDDFNRNMSLKIQDIQVSLDKCDQLKKILDELSAELAVELEKLRDKS